MSLSYWNKKTARAEAGATMVEFLISALFVLLAVVGLMDLTYYFALRGALTKGAQDGLGMAKVVSDFATDTLGLGPGDDDYQKFLSARNAVFAEARRVPVGTFIPEGSDYLSSYLINDGVRTLISDVVVLRPGDMATLHSGGAGPAVIYHPSICPSGNHPSCTGRPRKSSESMETLFRNEPIIVEMYARFRPITPLLPALRVQAKAAGYRELYRFSSNQALPALPSPSTSAPAASGTSSSASSSSAVAPSSSAAQPSSSAVQPSSSSSSSSGCEIPPDPYAACSHLDDDTHYGQFNATLCKCLQFCVAPTPERDAECREQGFEGWNSALCGCFGQHCEPQECPEGFYFDDRMCECVEEGGPGT